MWVSSAISSRSSPPSREPSGMRKGSPDVPTGWRRTPHELSGEGPTCILMALQSTITQRSSTDGCLRRSHEPSRRMTRSGRPATAGPRTAIVLGSGGFRGPAHVGVLARLVELRVPLYAMVGCSVGSLITAYYAAAGRTVDEVLQFALETNAKRVMAHALSMRSSRLGRRLVRRWAD